MYLPLKICGIIKPKIFLPIPVNIVGFTQTQYLCLCFISKLTCILLQYRIIKKSKTSPDLQVLPSESNTYPVPHLQVLPLGFGRHICEQPPLLDEQPSTIDFQKKTMVLKFR